MINIGDPDQSAPSEQSIRVCTVCSNLPNIYAHYGSLIPIEVLILTQPDPELLSRDSDVFAAFLLLEFSFPCLDCVPY